jgi:hypothetical protein
MQTTRPRIRRFLFVLAALALGLASWLAWPRLWISPPQPAATDGGPRWPFPGVRLLNSEELKAANALSKVIGKKAVNLPKIEAWIRALRVTGKTTLTRAEFEEWMEGETAKRTPSLADFEAWAAAEEARYRTIFTPAEFQAWMRAEKALNRAPTRDELEAWMRAEEARKKTLTREEFDAWLRARKAAREAHH